MKLVLLQVQSAVILELEIGWDCHQTCLITLATAVLLTVVVTHIMSDSVTNITSTQACQCNRVLARYVRYRSTILGQLTAVALQVNCESRPVLMQDCQESPGRLLIPGLGSCA